ncbi:MAG: CARDB domain-containing protein [Dehalococcoidia bacterium]
MSVAVVAPDLTVSKSCTPTGTVTVGQPYSCTLTVTNAGAAAATVGTGTVLVRDALTVVGGTFSATGTGPAGYTCAGTTTIDCTRTGAADTINPSETRVFTVAGTVTQGSGSISDTATADPTGAIAESNETNNAAGPVTAPVIAPDLVVRKGCSPAAPATVASGGTLTCTLMVRNVAPVAVAVVPVGTVLVRDAVTLPAGVTGQVTSVAKPAGYACPLGVSTPGPATLAVDCAATVADSLPPGGQRVFAVTVKLTNPAGGAKTATDVATVDPAGTLPETDETNNTSAPVSTTVAVGTPPAPPPATTADLALTKVGLTDTAILGVDPVGYAVTVTNTGPAAAGGVTLTDTLPPAAQAAYVSGLFTDAAGRRGRAAGRRRVRRR